MRDCLQFSGQGDPEETVAILPFLRAFGVFDAGVIELGQSRADFRETRGDSRVPRNLFQKCHGLVLPGIRLAIGVQRTDVFASIQRLGKLRVVTRATEQILGHAESTPDDPHGFFHEFACGGACWKPVISVDGPTGEPAPFVRSVLPIRHLLLLAEEKIDLSSIGGCHGERYDPSIHAHTQTDHNAMGKVGRLLEMGQWTMRAHSVLFGALLYIFDHRLFLLI